MAHTGAALAAAKDSETALVRAVLDLAQMTRVLVTALRRLHPSPWVDEAHDYIQKHASLIESALKAE